jgi:hypothetical protein
MQGKRHDAYSGRNVTDVLVEPAASILSVEKYSVFMAEIRTWNFP